MSQPQKQLKIILIGESCLDTYRIGTTNRISPEAPVPVLLWGGEEVIKNGMASNVCNNFTNLGVNVDIYTDFVETKIRYIEKNSGYQLLRVDLPNPHFVFKSKMIDDWEADAIVISDYDKGFISYGDIRQLRMRFKGPMFLDTKKPDLKHFGGIITKINNDEWNKRISDHPNKNELIITGGSGDIKWGDDLWSPIKTELVDVCGAGDTFLAALATQYLSIQNGNLHRNSDSVKFAICASSITVQKPGVYAPTMEEIDEVRRRSRKDLGIGTNLGD